jgi:hypothetical protein
MLFCDALSTKIYSIMGQRMGQMVLGGNFSGQKDQCQPPSVPDAVWH